MSNENTGRDQAIYRGKLTGDFNANSHKITGLATPTANNDAATKQYCDEHGGGTRDYSELTNKPQINSVTLTGNKSLSDLGIQAALANPLTQSDIENSVVSTATNKALSANMGKSLNDAIVDKQSKISAIGILKGNGNGGVSAAVADDDFAKTKIKLVTTETSQGVTTTTTKEIVADGTKSVTSKSDWNPSESHYESWHAYTYDNIRWDATNSKWICRAHDLVDETFDEDEDMLGAQKNNPNATSLDFPTTRFTASPASTSRVFSSTTDTLATATDVSTAVAGKASASDLTALAGRVTTAEGTLAKALVKNEYDFYPGFSVAPNSGITIGADFYIYEDRIARMGAYYLGHNNESDNLIRLTFEYKNVGGFGQPVIAYNCTTGQYSGRIVEWLATKATTADITTAINADNSHAKSASAGGQTASVNAANGNLDLSSLFGSGNTTLMATINAAFDNGETEAF